MELHDTALGIATDHSTYDTMYLAFAMTMAAAAVVAADRSFVRDMQVRPDPARAAMVLPLDELAGSQGSPL